MKVVTPQDKPGKGRVLIVEDEALISLLLETTLSDAGYEVIATVDSVPAALEVIEHDRPDVVILDLNLKGVKVYPVAEKLAAAGIPFIFATGGNLDVDGFKERPKIRKPFREADLLESIERLMAPS